MCSLLCNFNCYCTLGASLMLALSAIDVSLHYCYMQNFHRKKKKKKVTIFATGGKFHLASNFTELHTLPVLRATLVSLMAADIITRLLECMVT